MMQIVLFYLASTVMMILLLVLGQSMISYGAIFIILLVAVYVTFSLAAIEENILAGKLRFGKYISDLKPGLHIVWLWIEAVLEVTTQTIESDLPDSPQNIYHGDTTAKKADGSPGDGIVPFGKTPALRVTFFKKVIEEPLQVKMNMMVNGIETPTVMGEILPGDSQLERHNAEIEGAYGFRVVELKTFYKTVGSIEQAMQNMDDHATAGFVSRLQKYSLAEARLLQDHIAQEVFIDLKEYASSWGIEVTFVRLKAINSSHRYNTAVDEAASAIESAVKVERDSKAEKGRLANIGEGTASAEKSLLLARADGFQRMAEIAGTPGGQFSMANDTAREVAKKSTLVIGGENGILGGMAGIAKVLSHVGAETSEPATPKPTPVVEPSKIILTDALHPEPKPQWNRKKWVQRDTKRKDKR